ncbi:MAG: zinc protease [Proteobacteria bacterium]|jgi:zinc protease|nr:zinc protease [Pseudomonadota bacterium]
MLKILRRLALCLAPLTFLAPLAAQTLPQGITKVRSVEGIDEYRLANGLQILLVPDDSKPSTTVNLTYRVGSKHENVGETGMAHLLEHMLFKGSPKHPQVWAEFTKRGLAANGSTSFDRTNYTASFSANADNLQWYLGWLADSMVNSHIAREDLDSEMTVVRNEMESGENRPSRILIQRTMAAMHDWHPYGRSVIGARSDVENVDIPRLRAFYKLYYQPDNATLIVSGKFDPPQVLKWVAESFGAIPKPTRTLPAMYTLNPVQDGERQVTLRRSGGAPLLVAGYHVPAGSQPDFAAVEMLAQVLGDVPSGRLHKQLTERQLASSTFAFAWSLADPAVMFVGAELAPGQDLDKARQALLEVSESVAKTPISDDELQRARTQWLNGWEQNFTDPENVGLSLSEAIALGDWRLFFLGRDQVRDVTLADVQRVAEAYLRPSNRTLGSYIPTDAPQRAPAPAKVDVAQVLQQFKPQAAAAAVEAFEATPTNIDARTQRFEFGGLKAAVLAKPTRGAAAQAVLSLRFGDEKTLFGQAAAAEAVARLLDKGTATLSRQQVQDRLDALKTQIAIQPGAGGVSVSLSSRREHLADAVALVAELLRRPAFPAEAFDEYKRQTLTRIEAARKEPSAVAGNALARLGNPYPRGDVRYARTFDEQIQDLNALTLDQVRAFHARFYGARFAQFGAAGDIDLHPLQQALRAGFGDWAAGEPFTRVPQPLLAAKGETLLLATPDKQNADLRARLPVALSDTDADYPALTLANHLLGSGGSSRLWTRIRETEGLSYSVYSQIAWNNFEPNSNWLAGAIFAPQNRAKVETALREELARALKDGFSAKELDAARNGLLSFRRLSRAQDDVLASALASNLYLGRTFEISARVDAALAAATPEQVNAALRKYLKPEAIDMVFAGDFKP